MDATTEQLAIDHRLTIEDHDGIQIERASWTRKDDTEVLEPLARFVASISRLGEFERSVEVTGAG